MQKEVFTPMNKDQQPTLEQILKQYADLMHIVETGAYTEGDHGEYFYPDEDGQDINALILETETWALDQGLYPVKQTDGTYKLETAPDDVLKTYRQVKAEAEHDLIVREATLQAAVYGHYDTSQEAQEAQILTISVFNMGSMEVLLNDVTHKFFIMVNATAYMVSRMKDGSYQVEEHDQGDQHREERELRAQIFDYAVYWLSGTGAGYMPGRDSQDDRARYVKELLEDERNADHYAEEEEPPASDLHPIIRDEPVSIAVGEGFVAGPAQAVARQWFVQIGAANRAHIGLIGYRITDDQPEFVGARDDDF